MKTTTEQLDQVIALLTAARDGKPIEFRLNDGTWVPDDAPEAHLISCMPERFRVKPEPINKTEWHAVKFADGTAMICSSENDAREDAVVYFEDGAKAIRVREVLE